MLKPLNNDRKTRSDSEATAEKSKPFVIKDTGESSNPAGLKSSVLDTNL